MAAPTPSPPSPPPSSPEPAAPDKYALTYSFRGQVVTLSQTPRPRDAAGERSFVMPTGWCCWEASNILLRWLAHDAHVARALGGAAPASWGALRFLDLSAGAGLVALAVAAAGAAAVAASDIPEQLPQLRANVARSGLRVAAGCSDAGGGDACGGDAGGGDAGSASGDAAGGVGEQAGAAARPEAPAIAVLPFYWGADLAQLRPAAQPAPPPDAMAASPAPVPAPVPTPPSASCWYDAVLVSDIVYIAIRDGLEAELEATLTGLAAHVGCIIMSFEERLPDEEQAILVRLGLGGGAHGGGAGGPPPLHVEELQGAAVRVDFEDSLQRLGAGGHADTDLFNPHLFWECPPADPKRGVCVVGP